MDVRALAKLVAAMIRREDSNTPASKSRLDHEADRIQLGCVLIVLLWAVALTWWAM